jgi:2-dehydropantoate 2-reductase
MMNIAIIGAGALGCYYGAKLARAGHTVHFIARGATLEAIRARGVRVIRDDEMFTVTDVHATDDATTVGSVQFVIVATKSYHFESIAAALRVLKGPDTIVLPLQNGVDSAERLGEFTDPKHILGGLTYLPATVREPGVVQQAGLEKTILLGPLSHFDDESAQTALSIFNNAGITADQPADIRVSLWMKFMGAIATMGVQSVTGCAIGPTREDADTRALYINCVQEVAAVARKFGIQLPDDAPDQLMQAIDSYPAEVKASMLQDLECGKQLEIDAMHGTVVRLGKSLGVDTPTNQFIYAALKLRAAGTVQLKS